jgi:hypothetical protein
MSELESGGAPLDLVLGNLAGVTKHGGYWIARCPAHDDSTASLDIKRGTKQPVILYCHAGCSYEAVRNAMGKLGPAPGEAPPILVAERPAETKEHERTKEAPRPIAEINKEFWFWPDRLALLAIFDFARARRVSPWALLGEVLLRVVVATPPAVQLPALVGGNASLNLFAGIVGRSGQGKGTATAAARDVIDVGRQITGKGIGSGEGLVKLFGKADKNGEVERISYAELLSIYEIDSFGAQQSRSGATIGAELRKTYSGEPIGFAYADGTKRVLIEAHSYRLCVSAGIQPGRGAVLLDDADSGTPQRFVWLPATDPDAPDIRPDEPAPLQWTRPAKLDLPDDLQVPFVMDVCETAKDIIDTARLARLRGDGDALDGHALLTRLKVAAALAILSERSGVTDDDWTLAGLVMEVSDQTRESVAAELRKATTQRNIAQGEAEAARARIIASRTESDAVKASCTRITHGLRDGEWVARGKLRTKLTPNARGYFEDALEILTESGLIDTQETSPGHGLTGTEYRIRP